MLQDPEGTEAVQEGWSLAHAGVETVIVQCAMEQICQELQENPCMDAHPSGRPDESGQSGIYGTEHTMDRLVTYC